MTSSTLPWLWQQLAHDRWGDHERQVLRRLLLDKHPLTFCDDGEEALHLLEVFPQRHGKALDDVANLVATEGADEALPSLEQLIRSWHFRWSRHVGDGKAWELHESIWERLWDRVAPRLNPSQRWTIWHDHVNRQAQQENDYWSALCPLLAADRFALDEASGWQALTRLAWAWPRMEQQRFALESHQQHLLEAAQRLWATRASSRMAPRRLAAAAALTAHALGEQHGARGSPHTIRWQEAVTSAHSAYAHARSDMTSSWPGPMLAQWRQCCTEQRASSGTSKQPSQRRRA